MEYEDQETKHNDDKDDAKYCTKLVFLSHLVLDALIADIESFFPVGFTHLTKLAEVI